LSLELHEFRAGKWRQFLEILAPPDSLSTEAQVSLQRHGRQLGSRYQNRGGGGALVFGIVGIVVAGRGFESGSVARVLITRRQHPNYQN
jgi:hypothetical protein